ncbi:hypothetical protein BaRGS_00023460 [Batillaria attramentaria]|uniref:HNF-p1 domain-containing protein n=1 Tax=Batillaria attramentaria TaxID=370345 RepID=A0ABD0KEB8_9CAEN
MASQNNRVQPTFTIEQIELIRRLRNSGLTKEQVVQRLNHLSASMQNLGICTQCQHPSLFPSRLLQQFHRQVTAAVIHQYQ